MQNKFNTITINKLRKLGFYFTEEEQIRFDKLREYIYEYPEEDDTAPETERFKMLYNLFDEDDCRDREVIEFTFGSPVSTDDEDCTKTYSHIEMNAFGSGEHCWTSCSVYEPKSIDTVKAVINLWNSSATDRYKAI